MTNKNLPETVETRENALTAEKMPIQEPKTPTVSEQDVISNLQAEINSLKEAFKALETQPKQVNQPNRQNFAPEIVKKIIANDFKKIDQLVLLGKLEPKQGAVLKNSVLQKAFGTANSAPQPQPKANDTEAKVDSFIEFENANPDFFTSDARKAVKSYLQEGFDGITPDELAKIAEIVKMLEDGAISGKEQAKARESAMIQTNEEAKKRLASNALSGSKPQGSAKIFTRDEIGKMSADEFRQNEKAIMAQLRAGQIK